MSSVIIFAYGAPGSMDNLKEYYTHIRHGNAPSEEEWRLLKNNIYNIGKTDLLCSITERQGEALIHSLKPYFEAKVKGYTAYKHTAPFVEDVACDLLSVTSNIEVLYDIGYDCQPLCKKWGLEFIRTEIPTDSYDFIIALTNIVKRKGYNLQ
ncbi:protoheme ferro-lyase [Evansella vedderi]|uniref:Protoheme ferro-lyase n=1 Tax=Evansella vedderi TaxID=38282 RepID=A0ABT9ZP74_9BACI|nr:hypothetical protein [Evansella vedderi]MDQ0252740.1 protoheme ferro-lyase [Evansella vedderi]